MTLPKGTDQPQSRGLLDDLVAKASSGRRSTSLFRCALDPSRWTEPWRLWEILGLSESQLSQTAKATLELLDGKEIRDDLWQDFLWKLTAFVEMQDAFDSPLLPSNPVDNCFQVWYFYFESRYLLSEALLCGLNAFYAAADSLLRTFLEFSIRQLYYHRVSREGNSFDLLTKYFETGIAPKWTTILDRGLPHDSFCRPIRSRLGFHHRGLSESRSHPYGPGISPRQHAGSTPEPSLEGVYFWLGTRFILQGVLWAYYANFPMLFHPRDVVRKFGFNPPVGVFVDDTRATAVRRSLSDDEYAEFRKYSETCDDVRSLLGWYDSMPDLSEEEILQTWNTEADGQLDRLQPQGYSLMMAKIRAIREGLSLRPCRHEVPDVDAESLAAVFSYSSWRKNWKTWARPASSPGTEASANPR